MRLSKVLTATAFAGVMALAGNSWAGSVSSQLFPGQLNQFSDNSGESLVNGVLAKDGNTYLWTTSGLRGTLDIQSVEDQTGGGGVHQLGGTSGNNELTGIFDISVGSATVIVDPDGSCTDPTCNGGLDLTGDELANFTFVPNTAALAAGLGVSLTGGTMIALFEDSTPNYDRTLGAQGAIEATATDGTLVLELGDFGDPDFRWGADLVSVDALKGNTTAQGGPLGTFGVQLDIGTNLLFAQGSQVPAFIPLGDGLIDANGSGGLTGTSGSTSAYDLFDNVDVVFNVIPEPGTLALFGFGLLFLGFATRRRQRKLTA